MKPDLLTDRRTVLKVLAALGLTGFAGCAVSEKGAVPGALIPGRGWVAADGEPGRDAGTPLQFMPKTAQDPNPLEDELAKYPKCPYCGMSRTKWHHSRHLVHYDDDLVDGTCSIHCLAISLSLNLDRGPKAIYAADFAAGGKIKPLVNVDQALYLVGSGLKGTMSKKSKMAFGSKEAAAVAQAEHGGELLGFDEALRMTYLGMAEDTLMIRKRRGEKARRMRAKMQKAQS